MGQLRLASEQQLACDCLSIGAGAGHRHEKCQLDQLSALMTLLWAIDVFVRQLSRSVHPDTCAGAEIREASSELADAVGVCERRRRVDFVTISEDSSHQKCFGDGVRCLAFEGKSNRG